MNNFLGLANKVLYFRKLDKLGREKTLKNQNTNYRKIIKYIYKNSTFYNKLYKAHGIKERHLDYIESKDLPIINKNILMENFDEVLCDKNISRKDLENFIDDKNNVGKLYKDKYTVIHSSGSTGLVGIYVYNKNDWNTLKAMVLTRATKTKLNFFKKTKLAFIGAIEGNYAGVSLTSSAPKAFYNTKLISTATPDDELIKILNDFQPDIINGYVSGAITAALAQKEGKMHISPSKIIGSGEPVTSNAKKLIKEVFNIDIDNYYGASESVCLGIQEGSEEYIKLFDDYHLFDIVDDNFNQVKNGEVGKLILSNLYNFTLPLIRYEMTDKLKLAKKQEGSRYLLIESIEGRKENELTFVTPNGDKQKINPIQLIEFFVPGLKKFQFIQTREQNLMLKMSTYKDSKNVKLAAQNKLDEVFKNHGLRRCTLSGKEGCINLDIKLVDDIKNNDKTGKFKLIEPYIN